MVKSVALKKYRSMRNFKKTSEPRGQSRKKNRKLIFVVQEHHARRLHYDFRLEYGGTLKSWAVPKGPSTDPQDKRLAVEVEDHPIEYAKFHGEIPKGQYGAGKVYIWDKGQWSPSAERSVTAALRKGHLDFELHGKKLKGHWTLIRLKNSERGKNNWLLFKRHDKSIVPTHSSSKKSSILFSPPKYLEPQLAQLVSGVPEGKEWIYEIKFDGYRTFCRIDAGEIQLLTRRGKDWSEKYKPIVETAQKIKVQNAFIDGELIWVDDQGRSDFQQLQNGIAEQDFSGMTYYVFDLLFLNGEDLRDTPLIERKKKLLNLVKGLKNSRIRYSEHWQGEGRAMYRQSCKIGLEGIISKDANAQYISGRSRIWQKTKCSLRQEFIIGGYSESEKARPFGALLLGVYDDAQALRYVGRVGTGFTAKTFDDLTPKLKKLKIKDSPFDKNIPRDRDIHWVKPNLVAEVEFRAWTGDGILRQASFQGLRADKRPADIHIEEPQEKSDRVVEMKVTHPERIFYKKSKIKKMDVVNYYDAIAPVILPYLKDRPLSILRCQTDTLHGCCFQKHGFRDKAVHYKDKKDTALAVESKSDLLELIQAGTIELHAWGAQFSKITCPDQIVFDLDPESQKEWPLLIETAHKIREMLEALDLRSFVKVTGGKGLHIHVPIEPNYSWDMVKLFSRSLMQVLEQQNPKKYTTNMNKSRRRGRVFLDYLRNGYGATAVVPYALRARAEPTIALPINWKDVKVSLRADQFTLPEVYKLLQRRKDPWVGFWAVKQRLKTLESYESHLSRD